MKKVFVIGAGFSGAVVAERLAAANIPVVVVERRRHIGGNSYSSPDPETGIECHRFGSHIFHTSDKKVWNYVNKFGKFNDYRHRVLASHDGELYPMPINLETIRRFFKRNFNEAEAAKFIRRQAEESAVGEVENMADKAVSQIGRALYEAFIANYTAKQWEKAPDELPGEIFSRIPVRFDSNDRYFSDEYEGIPCDGYAALFEKMLAGKGVEVLLNTSFAKIAPEIPAGSTIVYTGAVDELCDYMLGKLEWRATRLEWKHLNIDHFQPCAVVNYPDLDVNYTRIHEFKYYNPERPAPGRTVIAKEFSYTAGRGDEPSYPVPTPRNLELQRQYEELAGVEFPGLILLGRLGRYRYVDMDDAVAEALDLAENVLIPKLLES